MTKASYPKYRLFVLSTHQLTSKKNMARSRSIRRAPARKSGFFPEGAKVFIARRLYDAFALSIVGAGLYGCLALASYNHLDPSWNTAKSSGGVSNWAGAPGAFIADLSLQTIGIGGVAIALGIIVCGIRCFQRTPISPVWLRGIALLASSLFFAIAAAKIPSHGWLAQSTLGSSAGELILNGLSEAGHKLSPFISAMPIAITSAIIGLGCFAYACAVTMDEITAALRAIKNFALLIVLSVLNTINNFLGWVLHYNDPDYKPKRSKARKPSVARQPRMTMDEIEMFESMAEEEEEAPTPLTTQRPAKPNIPVVSKGAKKKGAQRSFTLSEGEWELPPLSLLQTPKQEEDAVPVSEQALRRNAELLHNVLTDFNVEGEIVTIQPGPVVTEPGKAVVALKWTVREMEDRYRAMSKFGVRNIEGYNERLREAKRKGETIMRKVQTGFDPGTGKPEFEEQPLDLTELPYIVVVVDEFADLMLVAGKDVENAIQRLAQMARAAGIHLIMATQRPSVDVITGVIKANFPTRISFQVTSKIDSRTILGEGGAEQLLGRGDMLYMAPGGKITRVHGPFVTDSEVEDVVNFLKKQGAPAYIEDVTDESGLEGSEIMGALFGNGESGNGVDELYDQAVALVAREGKASTSFVQRYLQIGYNRAARIIEEMEKQGVISKANAVGKREVLVQNFSDH